MVVWVLLGITHKVIRHNTQRILSNKLHCSSSIDVSIVYLVPNCVPHMQNL